MSSMLDRQTARIGFIAMSPVHETLIGRPQAIEEVSPSRFSTAFSIQCVLTVTSGGIGVDPVQAQHVDFPRVHASSPMAANAAVFKRS
jgi:hypothetical protein